MTGEFDEVVGESDEVSAPLINLVHFTVFGNGVALETVVGGVHSGE